MNQLRVDSNSIAHLKFNAIWKDTIGRHTATHHFPKYNVWRDIDLLPEPLISSIMNKPVAQPPNHAFSAGELLPEWQQQHLLRVPLKNFIGRLNGQPLTPRVGRFYPSGMVMDIEGVFNGGILPVRYVEQRQDDMMIDTNHPLARADIELNVEVMDVMPAGDEHGGRCTEALQELFSGPGMQLPYLGRTTDYISEQSLSRIDESSDVVFYHKERMVHHLDAHARDSIKEIYAGLLSSGDHVLDLMASWESHLPASLQGVHLTGLGMNESELAANPDMEDYIVHDLNDNPVIPLKSGMFDAVICTASVEYLTQPYEVFEDVFRLLKSGGVFVVTFSNRWFPTKTISLWPEMHEFERLGLVLEYFRQSGWSKDINTSSMRGLPRPDDDPYFTQMNYSDPVYAVWSYK
jgi:SAM-dependent methyltransferase